MMNVPSTLLTILKVLLKIVTGFATTYLIVFAVISVVIFLFRSLTPTKGKALPTGSDFTGQHVLVTGGSSGIGLEVARLYLGLGAKVTIVARNKQKLEEAKQDLLATPNSAADAKDRLMIISCDCGAGEDAVRKAFTPAITAFGDVDILINSAGTSIAGEFDSLDEKEFERMLRINVLGTVFPTRVVVPAMKSNGRGGRIVFVSSQVAQAAIHGYTAYAASKWALRGLAESLQMELKPYNITVSLSYPPDTDTPGYKEEMLTKPNLTKEISETGVVVPPAEVARDIVFYSTSGYYGISTGFDGWIIKQLHPGMSPVNSAWEVTQQVMFASIMRVISVFYVLYWDFLVGRSVCSTSNNDKQ